MIPQDYLNAITSAYPCPALSGFERAHWLFECREAVRWIAGFINEEYQKQIAAIQESKITSDTYEIIPLQRPESRVRLDLMREKYPDEFRELVYIKASDASKILGKKTLYLLAKEKAGEDVLLPLEQINVGDVEKTMLKEQAAELIETRMKTTDWAVQEIE